MMVNDDDQSMILLILTEFQTHHGNQEYRNVALSLLVDINKFILKQAWEWSINGRLLDIHAEFFVEIALPAGAIRGDGSYSESYNRWTQTYAFRC